MKVIVIIIIKLIFSPLMVTTFSLALGAACSTLMTICTPYWYNNIVIITMMVMLMMVMTMSISVIVPHSMIERNVSALALTL